MRTRAAPPAQRPIGFSLLEILLVLALIAAATLLAMAALSGGMRGMKLHSAAKDIAAQMRFARAVAISSGRTQDFVVDPDARSWRGANGRTGSLPDAEELVFTGASTAQFADIQEEGGAGVVRFFPDGAATGGRLRMRVNGGGWDVDIAWLTGEVRLHRVRDSR